MCVSLCVFSFCHSQSHHSHSCFLTELITGKDRNGHRLGIFCRLLDDNASAVDVGSTSDRPRYQDNNAVLKGPHYACKNQRRRLAVQKLQWKQTDGHDRFHYLPRYLGRQQD